MEHIVIIIIIDVICTDWSSRETDEGYNCPPPPELLVWDM